MGTSRPGLYARRVPRGKFLKSPKWDRNATPALSLPSLRKTNGSSSMPRYFFHVRDGRDDSEVSRDVEGQELPDLDAARREAVNANREMLGERLLHGGALNHRRIEIADGGGKILASISANDVLRDGQLNAFEDDVTKSAPSIPLTSTPVKFPAK